MDKYILLKTKSNNNYYFSDYYNHFFLAQPIMFDIMNDLNEGIDTTLMLAQDPYVKLNHNIYPKNDVDYYLNKIKFLDENHFFDRKPLNWSTTINKELINYEIFTRPSIVFETTSKCNLKCKYCGWGEYYDNYGVRKPENLSFDKAKLIIDYTLKLSIRYSGEYNIELNLGFYGGEPLLNFPFIKKVVEYAKTLESKRVKLKFSMATNGLLISKYQKFLSSNDLAVYISLDGDKFANSYRVYPNGKPSYDKVVNNIEKLKESFPDYFKKRIRVNAVLHNRNTIGGNIEYFKNLSISDPMLSSLSTIGIAEKKLIQFKEQFFENPKKGTNHFKCIEKEFFNSRKLDSLAKFHNNRNMYKYNSYSSILFPRQIKNKIRPTSTCNPFNRKMFVTTKGEIYSCEKIGREHLLGFIDDKKVNIDYKNIKKLYKEIFNSAIKLCKSCAKLRNCQTCIFEILNSNGDVTKCDEYINQADYSNYLLQFIEEIEKNVNNYSDSITNFQYT